MKEKGTISNISYIINYYYGHVDSEHLRSRCYPIKRYSS